jgi:steroid 5-alpha reductase family enzyme
MEHSMPDLMVMMPAALAMLGLAAITWGLSVAWENVGIVDSVWGLLFLSGTLACLWVVPQAGPRAMPLLVMVTLWALRLSIHITVRNWGEPDDRRYQAIRARNQPGFPLKSLYLDFGLQAVLAMVIAMPIFASLESRDSLNAIDMAGVALWTAGFLFEAIGDWQLTRFRRDPSNRGKVMDKGLWRYTRHPNYFGEAVLWWGFYVIAAGCGGWWTLFSPILMTFMLLRVSGVALLEKDIGERRPGYREYVARTPAFFPWMPSR